MITLALEASSALGSAAVLRDGRVIGAAETPMKQATRDGLLPAVIDALESAAVDLSAVGRVVCGAGPGSFTSLRVAAALAKGMVSVRRLPLCAVPSLALIAGASPRTDGVYLVVTDALRDERFVASYEVAGGLVCQEVQSLRVISSARAEALAAEDGATIIGPEIDGSMPKASSLARLSSSSSLVQLVDAESWEPAYGRLAAPQARQQRAPAGSQS